MALDETHEQQLDQIRGAAQQFDPEKPKDTPLPVPIDGGDPGPKPKPKAPLALSAKDLQELQGAPATEGTSGVRQDVPDDLNFQPRPNQDNSLLRAQNQGFLTQAAKTVGNLVPNVAADIMNMAGHVGDLVTGDGSFSGGDLGKLADKIRDPFGSVYAEHPDKSFDLADSAWWMNNAAGFVEGAASFVIPGEGEAALGMKAAKLAAYIGGEGAITGTLAATKAISAFGMGYLMAADSGRKVYQEAYQTNYERNLRQGYDPQTADQKARETASEGAATTVKIGTLLNGALNLTAMAPMFADTPDKAITAYMTSGKGALQEGETLEGWRQRLAGPEHQSVVEDIGQRRQGLTSHAFQAFQVGLQGVNTEYSEKVGKEDTDPTRDKTKQQLDYIGDYLDKVTDQQGALSMLTGLFGGLTQNILMDHVPIHKVIKYDPTGKPLYKSDPSITEDGKKVQYQTQLVSARTRDIMNNRTYYDNVKGAILQDVDYFTQTKRKLDAAVMGGRTLDAQRYRDQLFSINNLNAITMGMTGSWQEVYHQIEQSDNTKPLSALLQPQIDQLTQQIQDGKSKGQDTAEAEQQLSQLTARSQQLADTTEAMQKGLASSPQDNGYKQKALDAQTDLQALAGIYRRISDRFAHVGGDPDMDKLKDHAFAQQANHYLLGRAIDKEAGAIARDEQILSPIHDYQTQAALEDKVTGKIRADVKALQSGNLKEMGDVMRRHGINAYSEGDMTTAGKKLAERLQARIDAHNTRQKEAVQALHDNTGFTAWQESHPNKNFQDYIRQQQDEFPIDDRLVERKAALEKAREEHEEQKRHLAELNGTRGSERFIKAVQRNAKDWQKEMDRKAAEDNVNLFLKQQDKAAAARLDKNQRIGVANDIRGRMRDNVDKSNRLKAELGERTGALQALQSKKGFFKHFQDLKTKGELRSRINSIKAELAQLDYHKVQYDKQLQAVDGAVQDSAVKEQTITEATREDIQQDTHGQQNASEPLPTGVEDLQDTPIPQSVTPQPEMDYAKLREQLPANILETLDNLEMVMPPDGTFHRDLVHTALFPFVENQQISDDSVHHITEAMKAWWDGAHSEAHDSQLSEADLVPVPLPEDQDPILEGNQVSPPPEPDSLPIEYNSNVDPDNIDRTLVEVGAKALTSLKVNTAAIQYMRVQKGNKLMFLPEYDKLDPNFNRNILKPNFVQAGDELAFHIDTNWQGNLTQDNTDENDEYGAPVKRADTYGNYTQTDRIGMESLDPSQEAAYANVPIKIVHARTGQTIGYLPRADWVTARRPDAINYRNVEDTIRTPDGEVISGNVEAQKARLLAVRALVAAAHNAGHGQVLRTNVTSVGAGHVFYSTDINRNTETSKLKPMLAKSLLPDPKLKFAILNKGTMMVGHGTPYQGPANFDGKTLGDKYRGASGEWSNIPMVLLPMPNGAVTESPMFTRKLSERPADIHTVAKAIETYLVHGTSAETDEHRGILQKIEKETGFNLADEKGLRNFINQYYTYTQKFSEVHTRGNIDTGEAKVPKFMLDIPGLQEGENKAAIKIGTKYSGQDPIFALTKDGKLNPEFDQALRDGLQTHYKNVVFSSPEGVRGINDDRPLSAPTIQRNGNIKIDKFDSYNEYLKTFTSTIAYGKHQASDGSYLYGANPVTEFDFNRVINTPLMGEMDAALPSEHTGDTLTPGQVNLMDNLMNFSADSSRIHTPSDGGLSIEDSKPATTENLQSLHTLASEGAKYNGKTPEQVQRELAELGITQLSPRFNPFLKC